MKAMQKLAGECTEDYREVSIVIYLFILGIIMGKWEQFECKHLLLLTLNKSADKDYLKYNCFELRQIRSSCQKVPQLKMIKISTQMRVHELGIQRRRHIGHCGGVVRQAILPINRNTTNLITVLTSVKCNIESELCLGAANVNQSRTKINYLVIFYWSMTWMCLF